MAKIKLGSRPKSFKREIKVPMLDGTTGTMELTYKYRTRPEFAEFADGMQAELKAKTEAEIAAIKKAAADGDPMPEVTQAHMIALQDEFNADYVMQVVEGWNLDIPFDREAVVQLAAELPAGITAIIGTYRDAIVEGRLGN